MARKQVGGRVQGGAFRGIPLKGLPGDAVRPTTGKVKEALFSMMGTRVSGAAVIDCFAGTGSLGIEALSRGAESVTFVEQSSRVVRVLQENLAKLRFRAEVRVVQGDAFRPGSWGGEILPADLILADPPYGEDRAGRFLRALPRDLALPEAWVILEHEAGARPQADGWNCAQTRVYGESAISIFEL